MKKTTAEQFDILVKNIETEKISSQINIYNYYFAFGVNFAKDILNGKDVKINDRELNKLVKDFILTTEQNNLSKNSKL